MDNDLRNRFRGSDRPSYDRPVGLRLVPKPQEPKPQEPDLPLLPSTPPSRPPKRKKPPKNKRKIILITLGIILLLGGTASAYVAIAKPKNIKLNPYAIGNGEPNEGGPLSLVEEEKPAETIRLIASGDMIAHDSVNQNAKLSSGGYDYAKLMSGMKPYIDKADIRFCNQSTPAGGDQFGISGYPVFNAPVEFARGIESVGCNLINIGTNHTNDKGQPLIDATVAAWDNRQGLLAVAGANRTQSEQNQNRYFKVKDMKFAFLSYSTYTNNKNITSHGVNMYSDTLAQTQITEARKNNDFVIVSMRWGTEYSPDINAEQEALAQKLADYGADVVLGHGPHVLQPVKRLKSGERETLVWYSLGNFLNTQLQTEALIGGLAVMEIDSSTKKIADTKFMPTYMHYEWTAEQKRKQDLAARTNLALVPLDTAGELMAKSQIGTTVPAQTDRVKAVLNKFTPIPIIKSTEY